jgi:hypothetical protein
MMGARMYLPSIGRFLSPDPIPNGSVNDYEYCGADPVNCLDISGALFGNPFRSNRLLRSLAQVGERVGRAVTYTKRVAWAFVQGFSEAMVLPGMRYLPYMLAVGFSAVGFAFGGPAGAAAGAGIGYTLGTIVQVVVGTAAGVNKARKVDYPTRQEDSWLPLPKGNRLETWVWDANGKLIYHDIRYI